MTNRMDNTRIEPGGDRDLDGLDEADRALLADLAPEPLADPGEAYFASLHERVLRRVADEATMDEPVQARDPWWRGLFDALRIRPVALGVPAAVAVALALVLVVRPTSRIPGLDWETLDASAVAREAKRLDPARALLIPSEIGEPATGSNITAADESAIEIAVDFDDLDASDARVAPPFVPVADVSGMALSDEEWTELRARLGEALDGLKI